jgi:hypothetical protein
MTVEPSNMRTFMMAMARPDCRGGMNDKHNGVMADGRADERKAHSHIRPKKFQHEVASWN